MTDLVNRITDAIFRKEGEPLTATNPGNLRACPWFSVQSSWRVIAGIQTTRVYPDGAVVQFKNNFWVPRTRAEGVSGAVHCVALRIAEGQTLAQLITGWAPPSENETAEYIAQVKAWAAIPDENVPLWNYIE